MQLRRWIQLAVCAGVIAVTGPATAGGNDGTPVRLEGYLDVAPSGVAVEKVVVVGFAGKARRLFITHSASVAREDRMVQVGHDSRPVAAKIAHGASYESSAKEPTFDVDGKSLSLSGPSNAIDQLMDAASGMRFAGAFTYREGSDRLQIERLEK